MDSQIDMLGMDSLDYLIDQNKVKFTINTLFTETDNRNWDVVKECFDHQVLVDFTSMGAEKEEQLSPEQITRNWEQGLKDLDAIHHQAGNYKILIKGDSAEVFCYGIATHYKENKSGKNTRTFVGSYEFKLRHQLESWKIDMMKFNLKFMDGNLQLDKA
jgi:hypothetical protein